MDKSSESPKILLAAAVFGQFLSLFPLAVLFCGLGLGRYEPLAYCAVYAVWAVFYALGALCGKAARALELSGKPSKKAQPVVRFLSRAAALLPTAVFIIIVVRADITTGALFYALPAALVAFFGAHGSVKKSYSDVFSRGWFAFYFGAGAVAALMLRSSHDEQLAKDGIFQICAVFALMILLSALLANQTNIDLCTKQRAGGKSVLPSGLRRYNAVLITVVCSVTIGLFVFARPLAELVKLLISLIGRGFLGLMTALSSCINIQDMPEDAPSNGAPDISAIAADERAGLLANLLTALLIAVMLVVLFLLRKHIWNFIKSIFEPLFAKGKTPSDIPFFDEILVSDARKLTPRARRRTERELSRKYGKEKDPARKYRLGYALFLLRLGRTGSPPAPSDTTTVHREKGESAFGTDLGELSEVYALVRYGENAPTAEELARQEKILAELKP
ncbi:MAG: DUF4129 domain-containing protein [Lachnospiraceae bacterium]|nr:DUF4129 domain-containing protein [Ruminococcus sp.]MCM1276444.1 DUF4129 domain-containing protein [Lachnospiraceae bacterium]